MGLSENVARVRERIDAACRRSGRDAAGVRLVAVSKTFSSERIREAFAAGITEFGENRIQEASEKLPLLEDLPIVWHLVGHLQSNKATRARELFAWVHSVDSVRLAEKLHHAAANANDRLPALLQVNLGGEESKFGFSEDAVLPAAETAGRLASLDVRGLMLIPPYFDNPEQTRPYFRSLRQLAERVAAARPPGVSMQELSMGMSHDFEAAIEEGATMIRVGTAIFGPR